MTYDPNMWNTYVLTKLNLKKLGKTWLTHMLYMIVVGWILSTNWKENWQKCYMKNEFILGIQSTQLSESLNGDLKDYLRSNLDMAEFFEHFDRVIEKKWERELQAEFNAKQKFPLVGLEKFSIVEASNTSVHTSNISDASWSIWSCMSNKDKKSLRGLVSAYIHYWVYA